jgi:hypothetical protein
MQRLLTTVLFVLTLAPAAALAQPMAAGGSTPLALDLKKVPVGSWAEYSTMIALGAGMKMTSRWALVARKGGSSTLEMSMEGGPVAMMGGKMIMQMVLVPNPVGAEKPITKAVMQVGDRDPMEMPLGSPGMTAPKFQKPDPKKLVGKEEVKVPAGTFKTSHYRDVSDRGTVDAWISDQVPPLGMVKVTTTPKPGTAGPGGQPMPPVTMELAARGKDAKPQITKPAKPFDPNAFAPGMHGGPPPGAAAPGAPPAPPPAKP